MKHLFFLTFPLLIIGAGCTQSTPTYTPPGEPDEVIENGNSGPDHGDIFVDEITTDDGDTIPQGYFDTVACMIDEPECENVRVLIFGEYVEELEVDNETLYPDSQCDSEGCTMMIEGDEWRFTF